MNLGVDPKHADQMVRGARRPSPRNWASRNRILVFAKGEKEKPKRVRRLVPTHVGGDELAKKIQDEGWLEFERVIATPDMMAVVGRLGKVLGPRGHDAQPEARHGDPGRRQRAVSEQQGRQDGVPRRQERASSTSSIGKKSPSRPTSSSANAARR